MKAAIVTVDMERETVVGCDFFHGSGCWAKASAFGESMENDFPKPRYKSICLSDKESRREGMEKMGITGMFEDEENKAA